ncbi:unnamed protein product [Lepeophtheirus salmonis]|uniref:(salmon louse) hypothetical protein n=1 Tax=Lepeophtheirus salmonis TaxID=72036 RepID=A0A817F9Z2_LEPSM|nr:unnamed protein product [Lepeophtheirus salmonis]CAG9475954.1 unnamed protein product [Lepeophtheirus salmonis]
MFPSLKDSDTLHVTTCFLYPRHENLASFGENCLPSPLPQSSGRRFFSDHGANLGENALFQMIKWLKDTFQMSWRYYYGQQMLELFSSSPVIGFYHINYLSYDNKLINWPKTRVALIWSSRTIIDDPAKLSPRYEMGKMSSFCGVSVERIKNSGAYFDRSCCIRQDLEATKMFLQISSLPDIQVLYSQLACHSYFSTTATLSYLGSGASGLSQNLSQFLRINPNNN